MYAVYLLHYFLLFIFYFFIFVRKTKTAFIAIVRLSGQEVDLFRSDYPHFVSTFTFLLSIVFVWIILFLHLHFCLQLFLFGSFLFGFFFVYIFIYKRFVSTFSYLIYI